MTKYEYWEQASKSKPIQLLTKENSDRKNKYNSKKIRMVSNMEHYILTG